MKPKPQVWSISTLNRPSKRLILKPKASPLSTNKANKSASTTTIFSSARMAVAQWYAKPSINVYKVQSLASTAALTVLTNWGILIKNCVFPQAQTTAIKSKRTRYTYGRGANICSSPYPTLMVASPSRYFYPTKAKTALQSLQAKIKSMPFLPSNLPMHSRLFPTLQRNFLPTQPGI